MTASFDWPVIIEGDRASIAPFDRDACDGDVVEADWIDEAAQAIAGRASPCLLQDRLDVGDLGWWIRGDGAIVGALCGKIVNLADPAASKALIWTWLAIDAKWRAYGYGGAAVPLFEQAAQQAGATVALAPLPPDNGVALYFWLRLGYTPVREVDVDQGDVPTGVCRDALWMQRPLNPTSTTDVHDSED